MEVELKLKKNLLALSAFLLIAVILGAALYFNPSFLPQSDTTLSITQIYVDPQGSEVGDEWRGGFWNILGYLNTNDDIVGVELPEGTTDAITYEGAVETLKTGASVEIKIDPEQPYLIRDLQEKTSMVTPEVGRSWMSKLLMSNNGEAPGEAIAGECDFRYYGWGEATWRIYTPFTVSVYKDGQLVGSTTLNDAGRGNNQGDVIQTSEGPVRIENLGILGGNYLSPQTPSQICIVKGSPIVYDWSQVSTRIPYDVGAVYSPTGNGMVGIVGGVDTYGQYWYGGLRWANNKHPCGLVDQTYMIGWYNHDDSLTFRRDPVKPVITAADKAGLPADKRNYMSLEEWLQSRGISNLASSLFNSRSTGDSGALWQHVSYVTDTNGQTALRLDIPWSAFGTPMVNIRVPVELADTWIERPVVTHTEVSAVWESTGSSEGDISGSLRAKVTLTNTGTTTGGAHVTAQSDNSKLSVTPLEMTVNNLEPNIPQTVSFDCTNLGVEDQIDNIPITFIAYDTYTFQETGRATLFGTLLPTLNTGQTTINIHAYERNTNVPIPSLQLSVLYPASGSGQSVTLFTGVNGETGGYTLSTPQGGAFTGDISITSADTTTYTASYLTYNIPQGGVYDINLEVERKDTTYPDEFSWFMIALIIGIIVLVFVIIAVIYYSSKHKKRRGRIRRMRA